MSPRLSLLSARRTVEVTLQGHLDAVEAPSIRRWILAAAHAEVDRVVVDLRDVVTMDAAGLSAIIGPRRELRRRGVEVVITGAVAPGVRRTLAVTRFAQIFDLGDDLGDDLAGDLADRGEGA